MSQFKVIASSLNVRSGPAKDQTKVGSLPKGTIVEPSDLSLSEEWLFIENPVTGWIFKDYCVPVEAESGNTDEPSWLRTAEGEIGTKEVPGSGDNPRVLEYHATTDLKATDDSVAWCSSFVNWCMKQNDIARTKSASARSWLNWGNRLDEPRKGCVVILKRGPSPANGHVGFYVGTGTGTIRILGGNQGDQVKVTNFPSSMLLGYRWPS